METEIPKIKYNYIGKESLTEDLKKSLPNELRPTKKTGTYFGWIFLVVALIALIQFPYDSLMVGNTDITINVGYPWHFLELSLGEAEKTPLLITGLLLDLLLYLIIAYSADVVTNLILKNPLLKSEKSSTEQPKVFKDRKSKTIAEEVTKKIIEKKS